MLGEVFISNWITHKFRVLFLVIGQLTYMHASVAGGKTSVFRFRSPSVLATISQVKSVLPFLCKEHYCGCVSSSFEMQNGNKLLLHSGLFIPSFVKGAKSSYSAKTFLC